MIKEIVQFTKALPEEAFSKNLQLKEGLYMFLHDNNGQLEINESKTLWVNKKTEPDYLYNEYLKLYSCTKMITNKSMNASEKIFIDIGSPYALSISGKGLKPDSTKSENEDVRRKKQYAALDAYFKAVSGYVDFDSEEFRKQKQWFTDFKYFSKTQLFKFFENRGNLVQENGKWEYYFELDGKRDKIKDTFTFYFFMQEPEIHDYEKFSNKYLETKVFLFNLEKNENHGISNDLNVGNVSKKPFMRHKTASFEINYKVDGDNAKNIYKFFKLKSENKILPNPCPVFVDQDELNHDVISFQESGKRKSYSALVKEIIDKYETDLQNYYLLYFQGTKGSAIIDIDFIPQFEYKINDTKLTEIFALGEKFREKQIKDVFELQGNVFNPIFNGKLCPKEGWIRYFDDIEPDLKYHFTDAICNLMLQYRKAIYDYIYKSRHQSITCAMFDRMMTVSILEDIRVDEYKNEKHSRGYAIKEKLNIWFSLYTHFNQKHNRENMASRIPELLEKMKTVANGENVSFTDDPAEFAFGAGQIVYFLLTKSAASNKSYAMLEPFLQKSKVSQLQDAIGNSIAMYKHEIDISKGRFEKLASEVLGYESDINMKEYLRYFLAGCFAQSVIYEKKEKKENQE